MFGLGWVGHYIQGRKNLKIMEAFGIVGFYMALEVVVGRGRLDIVFVGKVRQVEWGFHGSGHSLKVGLPLLTLSLSSSYFSLLLQIECLSG